MGIFPSICAGESFLISQRRCGSRDITRTCRRLFVTETERETSTTSFLSPAAISLRLCSLIRRQRRQLRKMQSNQGRRLLGFFKAPSIDLCTFFSRTRAHAKNSLATCAVLTYLLDLMPAPPSFCILIMPIPPVGSGRLGPSTLHFRHPYLEQRRTVLNS